MREFAFVQGGAWAVGFYVQGLIDRALYPQAPAGGAAARFEKIRFIH